MEFTHERNMALLNVLHQHLTPGTNHGELTVSEIFRRVVSSPCSRFWVSEERASVVIGAMLHKGPEKALESIKNPQRRAMFKEIYRRVRKLQQHQPGLTIYELVSDVVHTPAPCFYLSAESIDKLLRIFKRNRRCVSDTKKGQGIGIGN